MVYKMKGKEMSDTSGEELTLKRTSVADINQRGSERGRENAVSLSLTQKR
jgi:hypothetical protein